MVRHAGPRLPDDGSKDEPGGDGPGATLMKRRTDLGPPWSWAEIPRGLVARAGPGPPWRWARGLPNDGRQEGPEAPVEMGQGSPHR